MGRASRAPLAEVDTDMMGSCDIAVAGSNLRNETGFECA